MTKDERELLLVVSRGVGLLLILRANEMVSSGDTASAEKLLDMGEMIELQRLKMKEEEEGAQGRFEEQAEGRGR